MRQLRLLDLGAVDIQLDSGSLDCLVYLRVKKSETAPLLLELASSSLLVLDLGGCSSLTELPSLAGLTALQTLDLWCESLTTAPDLSGCMALTLLDLSASASLAPPPNIGGLEGCEMQSRNHEGVTCNGCEICPIEGTRYKKRRKDFDYCGSCMDLYQDERQDFVAMERHVWKKSRV